MVVVIAPAIAIAYGVSAGPFETGALSVPLRIPARMSAMTGDLATLRGGRMIQFGPRERGQLRRGRRTGNQRRQALCGRGDHPSVRNRQLHQRRQSGDRYEEMGTDAVQRHAACPSCSVGNRQGNAAGRAMHLVKAIRPDR